MIGVAIIVAAFLYFLKSTFSYSSNVSKIDFFGFLMLVNILVILGIFSLFYWKVKLIPTLWILSAVAPISFFIVNKALITADCNIGEVRVAGKAKKE